jgi:hypothetical protein
MVDGAPATCSHREEAAESDDPRRESGGGAATATDAHGDHA